MAMINVLEFNLTATNQRSETDTTPLRACVIVESVLVFVPLMYLVVYLVWKITRSTMKTSEESVLIVIREFQENHAHPRQKEDSKMKRHCLMK